MITRAVGQLWLINGRLRRTDSPQARWDARNVLLESSGYPSEELCQEALLHNWSNRPHEAQVLAVSQTDNGGISIKLTA